MIDFDKHLHRPIEDAFGLSAVYTAPDGAVVEGLLVTPEEPHQTLDGYKAELSTTSPELGVRASAFPDGVAPEEGGIFVLSDGRRYEVQDVQPDGYGWLRMPVHEVS